jgi:PAS domain S-box-containing protein
MFLTSNEVAKANKRRAASRQVLHAISQLDMLAYKYLMYHEKRVNEQWRVRYESLEPIIEEEETIQLRDLFVSSVKLNDLFREIVSNYEKIQRFIKEGAMQEKIDDAVGLENILGTHLLIISQSMINDIIKLSEKHDADHQRIQRLANKLILFVMLVVLATSITAALTVNRSISKSLHRLHMGMKVIGNGNLDYRVDLDAKDEIGQLSCAFDRMAEKLKTMTVSRDELDREIVERKKVRNNWDLLFKYSSDMICFSNLSGFFTEVNSAFSKTLGWIKEELLSKPFLDYIHPDDYNLTIKALDRLREGREVVNFENRYLCKNQSYKWLSWSAFPLLSEGIVISIVRDVTAHKKLEELNGQLAAIIKYADDAIIGRTLDGTIKNWNSGAEFMYGYSVEEIVGKSISLLIPPGRSDEHKEVLARILRGEHIRNYETKRIKKDGQIIDVSLTVSSIKDVFDKIVGVSTIDRNITEKKKMEKELKEARFAAEAANRAKSDFLSNMSHELRTPLSSIIGFSEIMLDMYFGPLNEKQKSYVVNIIESSHQLLSLINNILDLSKIEAGKMELRLTRFALKRVLEGALIMIEPKAASGNLALNFEFEVHSDIEIEADEEHLRHILLNLLSNAVKFTGNGGSVTVTVKREAGSVNPLRGRQKARREAGERQGSDQVENAPHLTPFPSVERKGEGGIEISVIDTGIGIKSEDMPKLFKEFSQLGSVYTKEYEGTGLGLAFTKKLIEMHGWKIWAESEGEGKGSAFRFVIPIKTA